MTGWGLHERLLEWLMPPQAPLIDEKTARERCAPLVNAGGQRERLIVVSCQDGGRSSTRARAASRSKDGA
jgi:rhodanese-related sulfurtransferase